MSMSITMLQTRMGEAGSLLVAGNTYTVSNGFGAEMVGLRFASDTNGVLNPQARNFFTQEEYAALIDVAANGVGTSSAASSIPAWDAQYGGYWDGINNDSPAIQNALDDAAAQSPKKSIMLPPTACMRDSVFSAQRVYVFGYGWCEGNVGTNLKIHADVSLSTGFLFNMNTVDGSTAVVAPSLGQWTQCGIFGVWCNNWTTNFAGVRLAVVAGTYIAKDLYGSRATQLIRKVSTEYIDNGKVERVFWTAQEGEYLGEYIIDIRGGGGDGLEISVLNFPALATPANALKVDTGRCRIQSMINGSIYFVNVPKAEVLSHHAEHCKIVAENTNLAVRSAEWQMPTASAATDYPIKMTNTTGNTHSHHMLELDDVVFAYGNTLGGSEGKINGEIAISHQTQVKLRNARRRISEYGSESTILGIRFVKVSDDTPLAELNRWSHIISDEGTIVGNMPIFASTAVLSAASDFLGIYASNQITSPSGTLANTTYYYTTQLLLDNTAGALIGRNQTSAEKSQATGGANRRLGLTLGYGSCSPTAILRVYRGTSTGSYDAFVDLPVMKAQYIVDQGTYCCGVAWVARGASGVDALMSTGSPACVVTPNGLRQTTVRQTIASSATPAVNCLAGNHISLTASNATVTFGAPSNIPPASDTVTFVITQDGTGGRTIAWNAAYIFPTAWSNTGNTANKKSTITFMSDGASLIAMGANVWY